MEICKRSIEKKKTKIEAREEEKKKTIEKENSCDVRASFSLHIEKKGKICTAFFWSSSLEIDQKKKKGDFRKHSASVRNRLRREEYVI